MISKKRLLFGVDEALGIQKRLIILLNRHISAAVSFSELDVREKEDILEKFQSMVITHTKHTEILMSIKEEIESGEANVY
ncbi:MAG: hypothetical protein WCV56_06265 [Candidatus Omnitrophota bacterium]